MTISIYQVAGEAEHWSAQQILVEMSGDGGVTTAVTPIATDVPLLEAHQALNAMLMALEANADADANANPVLSAGGR